MDTKQVKIVLIVFVMFSLILLTRCYKKITQKDMEMYRLRVEKMFHHAYDGYLKHAYPYDELRPLTCDGHDTWGSFSLTLIDALDTLAVMGNYSEFRRVANLVIEKSDFDIDINASVFETNIRVVGGLLSAHLLSRKAGMVLEPGWPCSGPLLRMAEDVARRLLPAFQTATGMPYGTVNLRHGVPEGETTVTCTAGVGTYLIEFGSLSRLTGDPIFEKTAMKAMMAMWNSRSEIGLLGNHIDVSTGKWTALDSGIGAGVDSYFEYLVKGSILFQKQKLLEMFREHEKSIETFLKREDWYMWAHMKKGGITLPVFQSLDAFWPGMQSLIGDIDEGMKTLHNFHQVWKQFGFTPEFYNIPKGEVHSNREGYPLRPELIESTMYLYRATKDPYLLHVGIDILESIEHSTKTKCGYATVKDVRTHKLDNRMESFFLAETTKYLYLLFAPDNFIHNDGGHGEVIQTPNGECVIDAGGYVFNTEAHPIDSAALYCCSAAKKEDDSILQDFHDNMDLLSVLGLVDIKNDIFKPIKKPKKAKDENTNAEEDNNSDGDFSQSQDGVVKTTGSGEGSMAKDVKMKQDGDIGSKVQGPHVPHAAPARGSRRVEEEEDEEDLDLAPPEEATKEALGPWDKQEDTQESGGEDIEQQDLLGKLSENNGTGERDVVENTENIDSGAQNIIEKNNQNTENNSQNIGNTESGSQNLENETQTSYKESLNTEDEAQNTENDTQDMENDTQNIENAQNTENEAQSTENEAQSTENEAQNTENEAQSTENEAQNTENEDLNNSEANEDKSSEETSIGETDTKKEKVQIHVIGNLVVQVSGSNIHIADKESGDEDEEKEEDTIEQTKDNVPKPGSYEEDLEDVSDPSVMTCPAQPFHARLSIMGEMFIKR